MYKPAQFASLPEALASVVQAQPQHMALVDPPSVSDRAFTYHEMWQAVICIANQLLEQRVEPGDRVGLLSTGRTWWPLCDFATMSVQALTVPIYPSLPANQIGFIVRHAEMAGIFVENEKQFQKLLDAHVMEPLPLKFVVICDDRCRDGVSEASPWPVYRLSTWLLQQADEHTILEQIQSISREQPATIVYTSGTTGVPKGVLLTHGNLLANLEGIRARLDIYNNDVHLSYLPLSHILERTCGLYVPLTGGACISYADNVDTIVQDFARVRPTSFTTVPRLLEKVQERVEAQMRTAGGLKARLYRSAMRAGIKARVEGRGASFLLPLYDRLVFSKIRSVMGGRLRFIVSGGAPLANHVGRFFVALGVPVFEGYGMTETSPVVAFNSPGDVHLGTVGRRLDNVEVAVAQDGELLVRGPSVTPGYYLNDEANHEAFTEDGWFKTGDIAHVSSDGIVTITDRKKNLLVLSTGKKVTPAPIESDLLQSPYIDQVCLIGDGQKFVSVIVVPNEEAMEHFRAEHPDTVSQVNWKRLLLEGEVVRTTSAYAKFEQPKALILAAPFTIENDLLTPTLKVKVNRVLRAYDKEIAALYQTNQEQGFSEAPRRGSL